MSSTADTRHACDLDFSLTSEGFSVMIDVSDSYPDSGEYHHTEVEMFSDMGGYLNAAVAEYGSRMHRRELPAIVRRAFSALEGFYRQNGPYELPYAHERSWGRFIAPFTRNIRTGVHPPRPYRVTHQGLHDYAELRERGYDPRADAENVARFLREHGGDPEVFTSDGVDFRHSMFQGELPATMPLLERLR